MQFSFSASGSRTDVLASVDAQVAKEKVRLAEQHARDRKIVPGPSSDAFPALEASAGLALDAAAAFVHADLGDVVGDDAVGVSFTITTHRPQR